MSDYHRSIKHIAVLHSTGGGACPEQHWGTLINGDEFYYRYRHGYASLLLNEGIGDLGLWQDPAYAAGIEVTEEDDGGFRSDRQRVETFETLLAQIRPGWLIRGSRRLASLG